MQLAIRRYAAAVGVAVIAAGFIHVTPMAVSNIQHRAVDLTSTETLSDLAGPLDETMNILTGADASAYASIAEALTSGGAAVGADATDTLQLFDPAFWEMFWFGLTDPDAGSAAELLLVGAIEQLPIVGPALVGLGFALFPVFLLLAYGWSEVAQLLGLDLQGVFDPALAGIVDTALPAGVSVALGDLTSLFGDAAGAVDPTALVQEVSTAFDPTVLTSVLDLNPIADMGAVIDPAAVADIGTALSTTIPGVAEVLTSLVP